ncbi:MAG: nicotinate (nicotinamide) nucleotide adenylyltransferase, partial [Clostridia bacterium]|nr:nicotinate (nicotinamide) nucleotide adenylyltransferase [Clostridia bacterium]
GASFLKIGILGGSFSPIHKGHLHAALRAKESLGLHKIFLIPAGRPPHKTLPEGTPSNEARLEMTRIGAKTIGADVLDIEILREGKSYTAETLAYLKNLHPEDELFFIMGTDMILTVDTWYKPEVIFSLATLCAVARDEGDIRKIEEKSEALIKLGAKIEVIRCEPFPASSTEIRADISAKRHLLPDGVYDYILRENLYGIP